MSEASNSPPAQSPAIPDKLYFRIGEVARLLGVEAHTLRFWETEFPQLRIGKGGTGQRLYRRRDVELVLEIKHLLYEQGYTIPGARQLLQGRSRSQPPKLREKPAHTTENPPPSASSEPKLEQIRSGLRDLSAMLADTAAAQQPSSSNPKRERRAETGSPRTNLHLTPRSAEKQDDSEKLPGLFPDPD